MNLDIMQIKESASIELMSKVSCLKQSGRDIIGLTIGEPNFDTPFPIVEVAVEEMKKGNTHYCVGKGIPELRQAIVRKLKSDNNIDADIENIIVTPGCKMAIYLAVRSVVKTGDDVLVLTPSWVSYTEIIRSAGANPIEVPLKPENGYEITIDILEEYLTTNTRMIIVNSPNNPTGRVMSSNEAEQIRSFVENRDIVILADEIYEKIIYDDCQNISLASFSDLRDKTITINGFSKSYAMTGWRLGYICAPQRIIDVIYKLYSHTCTGTSPFIQKAAVKALECERYVADMKNEFEKRRNYFAGELKKIKGINIIVPQGAFYIWAKFDGIENIADYLLEKCDIVGVPGEAYGSDFKGYIRFSFAYDMQELEKAVEKLKGWNNRNAKRFKN